MWTWTSVWCCHFRATKIYCAAANGNSQNDYYSYLLPLFADFLTGIRSTIDWRLTQWIIYVSISMQNRPQADSSWVSDFICGRVAKMNSHSRAAVHVSSICSGCSWLDEWIIAMVIVEILIIRHELQWANSNFLSHSTCWFCFIFILADKRILTRGRNGNKILIFNAKALDARDAVCVCAVWRTRSRVESNDFNFDILLEYFRIQAHAKTN